MKRKFLSISLATVVCSSGLIIPLSQNHALAYEDLDKKKEGIQNKLSENKSKLIENERNRSTLESQEKNLNADLEKVDTKIVTTNTAITSREKEIELTNKDIEKLKKEIEEINKRIKKRNKLLQDRARSLQESGGNVNYIDVLLGAQSFSDFISRIYAVSTIVDADKELLEAHKKDLELVKQKEAELNSKLENLKNDLTELESLKTELEKQQKGKNKLLEKVKKDQKESADELGSLENEAEILKRQEEAIKAEEAYRKQKEKEEEEKRIAEEKRKAEEAKQQSEEKRILEEKKQQSNEKDTTNIPSSQSSVSEEPVTKASEPTNSNTSGFIRPAPGTLTSNFGARWGTTHFGVDIAQAGSDVPIYAAAAGTVYSSQYSSSYGNVVFITHNINGQTYQTVYAHMSSRQVSTGDRVEQGQRIGTMGNTGDSQGQHLHFELHKGLWNGAKSNAVNPVPYIQ
ncbi:MULTISPECIES: murein hydrolase activator EnvC family protein [Bacillus]|uniref:Peptidase M23 n=2 Tax=Bacillus TaxID=1386 RepID=A0A0M3R9S2_9BACI|nr:MULTISPECIES: peptidoglycan DD-metalloendopeptidase family protein [Bacillus]ALC81932.1 peptidase M23 [Bacillus gobiensis]MBP1083260.1 peptidoglycan hydrolase CwlO-like protein [Bacillus capparidis]MED1097697.1 peptidoglycan DD-metalloendopeptidase family protein [Bacillus capparidis]